MRSTYRRAAAGRSAAEWALGELIIRLCNRGRSLKPERPEAPALE